MNAKDFALAEGLYNVLCLPSDCYTQSGDLKKCDYVVAIDDDVTSAIHAVKAARQIKETYGFFPTILCVGGQGILSRHLYGRTEAEVLADVCRRLGYPKDLIWHQGLNSGRNTGENIKNIAKVTHAHFRHQPTVLFCVTKRQSLRYILTQQKQEPYLKACWYVIEEPFQKACKLMNAKSLCGGEMMVHEIAAILPRCQQYAGTYQEYPPFEITAIDFLSHAAYLAQKYCLKLGGKPRYNAPIECIGIDKFSLIDYLRYARLWLALVFSRRKILSAIDDEIWGENFNHAISKAEKML